MGQVPLWSGESGPSSFPLLSVSMITELANDLGKYGRFSNRELNIPTWVDTWDSDPVMYSSFSPIPQRITTPERVSTMKP